MIQLMTQNGARADRTETVRGAREMGGDAPSSAGTADQLGMNDILALLDTLHSAQGEPDTPTRQSQADAAEVLEQSLHQSDWTQFSTSQNGAGIDRLAQDRSSSLAGLQADQSPRAAPPTASLPLEQIEQWLAELQDLRSRHAAETETEGGPIMGMPVDLAPMPEPPRLNQQGAFMATQWSGFAEQRAVEQQAFTGSRLAPAGVALETSLQAGLMDEPALQTAVSKAPEALTAAALGAAPAQQAVSQIVTPAEIRLQGSEARWGEQMLQALRDQVEMQIAQRSQHATIRLDPPDLGTLDIQINHEQGKLSVQINAGQADVARLLNMLTERLRHELLDQNFTEVKVQIGSHADQGRQGRQRQDGEILNESISAARVVEQGQSGPGRDASSDLLISV